MITFKSNKKPEYLNLNYSDLPIESWFYNLYGFLPHVRVFPAVTNELFEKLKRDANLLFSKINYKKDEEITNDLDDDILTLHSSDHDSLFPLKFGSICQGFNNFYYLFNKDGILYEFSLWGKSISCSIAGELDRVGQIEKDIKSKYVIKEERRNKIGLLIHDGHRLTIQRFYLSPPSINIDLNYGCKFKHYYDTIIKQLKENRSGLHLYHGEPGTGKTHFIKHLCSQIERSFVFIPANMVDSLTSPQIMPILLNKPNCVLILEDAEKAIISRENNGNDSLVANILNLSDGILGSLVNLLIIITFNTAKEKIDPALLRKGRLLAEVRFDKLNISDAQKLIDHLGHKEYTVKEPMSLAEVYNLNDDNFHQENKEEERKIGFLV